MCQASICNPFSDQLFKMPGQLAYFEMLLYVSTACRLYKHVHTLYKHDVMNIIIMAVAYACMTVHAHT